MTSQGRETLGERERERGRGSEERETERERTSGVERGKRQNFKKILLLLLEVNLYSERKRKKRKAYETRRASFGNIIKMKKSNIY